MIIKTHKHIPDGLAKTEYKKDNFIFTHLQDISEILRTAHMEREFGNNGWTKDKKFRKIATVPAIEILKRPGLMSDGSLMARFLRGEGAQYLTVKKGV